MRERTSSTVLFRIDVAEEIAARKGLTTVVDKAAYFGLPQHSQWVKIVAGTHKPGRDFIARVLSSPAKAEFPDDVTFDKLFQVVA